jgi:peptide/nickel transport system permease protein
LGFIWYLIIRLGGALVTIAIGAVFVFILMQLIPGDPAIAALGENATDENIAAFRRVHGLDQPLPVQFWIWLAGIAQGDFGTSITLAQGYPVWDLMIQRLPNTLFIAVYALLIAVVISFFAGSIAALRQGRMSDTAATSASILGISMPDFWLSYVLILVFSLGLGLLPAFGFTSPLESFSGALVNGALPAFAIAAPMAGVFARILRAALLETKRRDYVTAARSFGFRDTFVYMHYIFRNALIPFVTVIGVQVRYLIGGTVIIERIFGIAGLGSMMVDGAFGRDYAVVQACMLAFLVFVLAVNLLVDIICAFLDPRRTH